MNYLRFKQKLDFGWFALGLSIFTLIFTSQKLHKLRSQRFEIDALKCIVGSLWVKSEGKPCFLYTQLDFTLIFTSQNLQKLRSRPV